MPSRFLRRLPAVLLCILTVSAFALAAPRGIGPSRLPDEARSLAGITVVNLHVAPLPDAFLDAGATEQKVSDDAIRQLTEAGFEIARDPKHTPRLTFAVQVIPDLDIPDKTTFIAYLEVAQSVRINRLDKQFIVPTMTLTTAASKRSEQLRDELDDHVERLFKSFIDLESQASSRQ